MRSIATLALMAGTVAIASGQSQPRFRADVDLLVVSAIVRDAGNALVRGLARDDFELLEDGKPVDIATFAEAGTDARASLDDGRFLVLLLDDYSTHPQYTQRIKDVAYGFVNRMGPKDVMSVVMLNGGSSVTTQRPAEVRAAIDRSKAYGKAFVSPTNPSRHAMDNISSLAAQLARVPHRRKVIVCIGPAATFNPATHVSGSQGEAGIAMRDTARANVTTYVIDPLGLTEKRALSTGPIDDGVSKNPGIEDKGQGFRLVPGRLRLRNRRPRLRQHQRLRHGDHPGVGRERQLLPARLRAGTARQPAPFDRGSHQEAGPERAGAAHAPGRYAAYRLSAYCGSFSIAALRASAFSFMRGCAMATSTRFSAMPLPPVRA